MLAPWTCLRRAVQQKVQLQSIRAFCLSTPTLEKALPPRRKITDDEITETFLRGTGPGGQKINKTSCAVQIKHLASGIVVKSQHTRSREMNRKYARQILGEKLDELEKGTESRTAIKSEKAKAKKASANKKTKRKYKKLDEAKAAKDGVEDAEVEGKPKDGVDFINDVLSQLKADGTARKP